MANAVTYDAECNFCNSVVDFLRKHDKKGLFRYVALQSDEGAGLIKGAGLPEKDRSTVVYYSGKNIYLRSTAVLHILKDTGGVWSIFYLLIVIPRFIRDWAYKMVARYRYRLK